MVDQPPASVSFPLTYDAYLNAFFTEPEEMRRCDIVDGVKEYIASPTWGHQALLGELCVAQGRFEKICDGYVIPAPFDVVIRQSPLRMRQPDLLFIGKVQLARGGGIPQQGPLTIAPELVIEILSTSETVRRFTGKLNDYISIGVRECWVIRPEPKTVEVLRLTTGGAESAAVYDRTGTVCSEALPDLAVPVSDIFNP